jgi:hypothetical protein
MSRAEQYAELAQLIDALHDAALDEQGLNRLQDIVESDPEARRFYVDYQALEASLHWDHAPAGAPADNVAGEAGLSTEPLSRTVGLAEGPGKRSEAPPGLFVAAYAGARAFLSRQTPFSLASAAIITPLMIAALIVWITPRDAEKVVEKSTGPQRAAAPPVVGQLTRVIDVEWSEDARSYDEGHFLLRGQSLQIESGLCEVEFKDGSRVILAGPIRFQALTANSGYLDEGKLTAHARREFAIATPDARVVDLGTDFGVKVGPGARTHVRVFSGSVKLEPQGEPDRSRTLRAGEWAVTRHGVIDNSLHAGVADEAFVRTLPPRPEVAVLLPVADCRILQGVATPDAHRDLLAVHTLGANVQRSLLRFDLSELPADREILSARLTLWQASEYASLLNPNRRPMEIYRATAPWDEERATWTQAGETAWTTPGGAAVGTTGELLVEPYAANSANVRPGGAAHWDLTDLVKVWAAGEHPNHGLLLRSHEGNRLHFYSRDVALSRYAPQLVIQLEGREPEEVESDVSGEEGR